MSNKEFDQFQGSPDYVASEELRKTVNVAIALKRPLLVRGEPGTGKTALVHELARRLVAGHDSIPPILRDHDVFELSPSFLRGG